MGQILPPVLPNGEEEGRTVIDGCIRPDAAAGAMDNALDNGQTNPRLSVLVVSVV
jgi:hypothetical protein